MVGVTERGQGDWISISFIITNSLCSNYVGFVFKSLKRYFGSQPYTPLFQRCADTSPPLGLSLPPVQRQSFSWVAKDNEVVTLDWGRKSVVFLCPPFMLRNNQYGNPLSVLHEILGEKQEQALLCQCLQPLLIHHSLSENTCARWIHKYIWCCFDGETGKNTTAETANEDWLRLPVMLDKLCIPQKGVVVNHQRKTEESLHKVKSNIKLWHATFRMYQLQLQNADQIKASAPWLKTTCSSINAQCYR